MLQCRLFGRRKYQNGIEKTRREQHPTCCASVWLHTWRNIINPPRRSPPRSVDSARTTSDQVKGKESQARARRGASTAREVKEEKERARGVNALEPMLVGHCWYRSSTFWPPPHASPHPTALYAVFASILSAAFCFPFYLSCTYAGLRLASHRPLFPRTPLYGAERRGTGNSHQTRSRFILDSDSRRRKGHEAVNYLFSWTSHDSSRRLRSCWSKKKEKGMLVPGVIISILITSRM